MIALANSTIPLGADEANDTLDALMQAEAFVAGFEGDPTQTGVADILAGLRLAINREQAAPKLLAALKQLYRNGQRQGWSDGYVADMGAAEAAIALAEGPQQVISAPSIAPTLDDLRSALERAERDEACADMIDDFARRQVELPKAKRRVAELRDQITRIEESL